jgi:hypothetical protein
MIIQSPLSASGIGGDQDPHRSVAVYPVHLVEALSNGTPYSLEQLKSVFVDEHANVY